MSKPVQPPLFFIGVLHGIFVFIVDFAVGDVVALKNVKDSS